MEDSKLKVLEDYAKDNLSNVTFMKEDDTYNTYIGSDNKRYIVFTKDEVSTLYDSYIANIANAAKQDTYLLLRTNGYDKWIDYIKIDKDAIIDDVEREDMETVLYVKYVLEESKYYEGEYYTICEE